MNKRIVILVLLGLLCHPFIAISQDSIPATKDVSEEKELTFQQFFFKALSEKSITHYDKAIENLERCNEILPNNISVLFEFSKNYLLLNKTFEAKIYIEKALVQKPEDIWMLSHLVSILKKERDFKSAVKIQQKIIKLDPTKKEELVYLYLQDRDYKGAMDLMNSLELEGGLSRSLRNLKSSLAKRKPNLAKKKQPSDLNGLIDRFKNDPSSFEILQALLEKADKENKEVLNTYSEEALALFPAQPFAYLMRGRSLNYQKAYKKALSILESGIDFVIDKPSLEANFYDEMARAYDGLKNTVKAVQFRNRAKKLRSIK